MVAQTPQPTSVPRRFGSLTRGADILDCDEKTIRRYVSQGLLTGYRVGPRNIRVDLNEVEALAQPILPVAS